MNRHLSELSALLDDELEDHAVAPLLAATTRDCELRNAWKAYALIGDQLRKEPGAAHDMTAEVMARIREEPVVLAPRKLPARKPQHPVFALAASVAGVAVVGWLALSLNGPAPATDSKFVAVPPQPTFAEAPRAKTPVLAASGGSAAGFLRNDMSEYLVAHQTHASSFRLGDSTEHVRTVALTGKPAIR